MIGKTRLESDWRRCVENIVVEAFPPAPKGEDSQAFSLTGDGKLQPTTSSKKTSVSYDSQSDEFVSFTHVFSQTTRLMGISKAVLYMSCNEADNMDVYILIEKLDAQGQPMTNFNIPWSAIPVKSFDDF